MNLMNSIETTGFLPAKGIAEHFIVRLDRMSNEIHTQNGCCPSEMFMQRLGYCKQANIIM